MMDKHLRACGDFISRFYFVSKVSDLFFVGFGFDNPQLSFNKSTTCTQASSITPTSIMRSAWLSNLSTMS